MKKISGRLAGAAIALTLVTTCLLGGTLAKYTSTVSGTASAKVAAWSFDVTQNGATIQNTNIDLATTAYTETTLKSGVIAPGASGAFDLVIDGTGSDVGIEYTYTIKAATDSTIPKGFVIRVDNKDYVLNSTSDAVTIPYSAVQNDMKKTVPVVWLWAYDKNSNGVPASDDADDTTFGTTANSTISLDISVTGTQVEPTVLQN